jgi:hypothetical protein
MDFAELEEGLKRIPGVTGVKVIGDTQPSEIHVMASKDRAPKQLVRDVQSMAAAGYGFSIDHRIVSIVQMEPPASNGHRSTRILIERIELAKAMDSEWVKVVLRHPDGAMSEGSCTGGGSRVGRGKAAVIAALRALDANITSKRAAVDLENLSIQRVDTQDAVSVALSFTEGTLRLTLLGTAVIEDDIASASIKALMQALNRKLQ